MRGFCRSGEGLGRWQGCLSCGADICSCTYRRTRTAWVSFRLNSNMWYACDSDDKSIGDYESIGTHELDNKSNWTSWEKRLPTSVTACVGMQADTALIQAFGGQMLRGLIAIYSLQRNRFPPDLYVVIWGKIAWANREFCKIQLDVEYQTCCRELSGTPHRFLLMSNLYALENWLLIPCLSP